MATRQTVSLRRTIWCLTALFCLPGEVPAEVQPDRMFSSHMVLQRGLPVPVWGTAEPGEKVTVAFRQQKKETTAGQDGTWSVRLDPLKPGEPGELTVSGTNSITFEDVLVGEVWVGSGQSNMVGHTSGYMPRDEVLAKMVHDAPYPRVGLYEGEWRIATEENIKQFSALGFSLGLPLQQEWDSDKATNPRSTSMQRPTIQANLGQTATAQNDHQWNKNSQTTPDQFSLGI